MALGAVNAANLLRGPGILYWSLGGVAYPANTVTAAGKFSAVTADWTTPGWKPLGATKEGSMFSDTLSVDPVEVAESYYRVASVSTGREATWKTALAEINATNIKAAMNSTSTTVTSGVAGSELTTVNPPTIGGEIRAQIGWQSEDDTVRFFGRQALNLGDISLGLNKGADYSVLEMNWFFEKPGTAEPYTLFLSGAERAK